MPFHAFEHEAENNLTLALIPLDVRRKLDLAGVKLKLVTWQALSLEQRRALCETDADGNASESYRALVLARCRETGADPELLTPVGWPAPWSADETRQRVVARAGERGTVLTPAAWTTLADALRYAMARYVDDDVKGRFPSVWREIEEALNPCLHPRPPARHPSE